jgi:hypothetical protein
MPPPAVSVPPRRAAPRSEVSAAIPELHPRAPFSRPRHRPPPLADPRILTLSLALHLAAVLVVLRLPASEPRLGASFAPPSERETVSYLDVGQWADLATDATTALEAAVAAEEAAMTTRAVDSPRLRARSAGDLPLTFPDRAPSGLPPAGERPGAGGGGAAAGAHPSGGGGGLPRSGPGGFGPELGDARLVVPASAVAERELGQAERYQRDFERRIRAINDSISGEAERARRASDWTITDRNGNRWGLDERGLIVGGQRVPTPRPEYGRPQRDREDEARREREQRREIDRQAEDLERTRHLRERQRAIRERADREREERRRAEGEETP